MGCRNLLTVHILTKGLTVCQALTGIFPGVRALGQTMAGGVEDARKWFDYSRGRRGMASGSEAGLLR